MATDEREESSVHELQGQLTQLERDWALRQRSFEIGTPRSRRSVPPSMRPLALALYAVLAACVGAYVLASASSSIFVAFGWVAMASAGISVGLAVHARRFVIAHRRAEVEMAVERAKLILQLEAAKRRELVPPAV